MIVAEVGSASTNMTVVTIVTSIAIRSAMTRQAWLTIVLCTVAACGGPGHPNVVVSDGQVSDIAVDTVASGLDVPWAMAFTPDGRLFVTERTGRIRVIENDRLRPEPFAVLPVPRLAKRA
jgi:glucose/arabinose dehydrogenase